MAIEVEQKPRKLRIVSGSIEVIEEQLNRLLDDYAVLVWNFSVIDDRQQVTAVLISARELRQQAMAAAAGPVLRRN